MLFLALDTTTAVCSVALGEEGRLMGEYLLNIKKNHSQRLMPLLISLLRDCEVQRRQLQGIAVAIGPGSFTGIRIGVATARGLAQGLGIPLIGVNTLEALAGGCAFFPALICPLLDARRGQVYTAVYRGGGPSLQELEPPQAVSLKKLGQILQSREEDVIFLGDNLPACRQTLQPILGNHYREMSFTTSLNRASFVLQQGFVSWLEKGATSLYALEPFYLRLPEAQRRLLEQQKGVDS
ncbi:MAG: tRNA (adenosine(37)-N6)-threonylcarbamoyltransferase complex dimerization subunit type 1 TsaB [Bacillota bacterium]